MDLKFAAVALCLAMAGPALGQVLITPGVDQTRPSRGALTPEEEERQRMEQEDMRLRAPEDYDTVRRYEGRARFVGTRPGKCPLHGSVRATVRGNTIDASVTFPIERDAIHGYISGNRFQATGSFGYTMQGQVNEAGISGIAVKKAQVKPSPQEPIGVPIPFIPGPSVSRGPPPPPIVQDCSYAITLNRVS